MGVTSSRPTWLLCAGLVAVFAGWRIFHTLPSVRLPMLVLGSACLLLAAAWRLRAWRKADGEERSIAAVFAFGTVGCLVALATFVPGTDSGLELLDLDFERLTEQLRFKRVFSVAAPILLGCSLLPVLGAQWAVGKGGSEGALPIDALRARETAANALSLGVAAAALMMIGYVTTALNRTADFSYFKTSQPGDAVREIVLNLPEPLTVALFFPAVNPVKDEALDYFRELARATDRVVIEEYDRFADPDAAADYEARGDGTIFLRVGDATERMRLPLDLEEARGNLRILDGQVQMSLLLLVRERRFAYLTTGHGELNDYLGIDPEDDPATQWTKDLRAGREGSAEPPKPLNALRQLLAGVNYEAQEMGILQGLGDRVPDDAAMVMIIAPQTPFLDEEMNSIRDYLDRGGSLLVALEPGSDFRFRELRDHLGIDYDPAMTVDDENFIPERYNPADRRNIYTNRFSTHPSVTTASRYGVTAGVLMVGPGRLTPAEDVEGLRTTLTVNGLPSNYQDRNGNFRFDEEIEVRGSHAFAAAVEREPDENEGDAARPDMRALVYADAEIFTDRVLLTRRMQAALVVDGIRWLGREEAFAGNVVSEEDVPIRHTHAENVAWFYAIIFGGPTLVLGAGLLALRRRRRDPGSLNAS